MKGKWGGGERQGGKGKYIKQNSQCVRNEAHIAVSENSQVNISQPTSMTFKYQGQIYVSL